MKDWDLRKQLEEIVLSTLLNQVTESQISFLEQINKKMMLSRKEKDYHDQFVRPVLANCYDKLSSNPKISRVFKSFGQRYFPSNFLIGKLYNKKRDTPSSVTGDELNEVMHYYTSNDNDAYDELYVEFLFNIIEFKKEDKEALITKFYDDIYTCTTHSKRASLMSYLKEKKKYNLMDQICSISERKGLPGIVFDEPIPSDKSIIVTVSRNNEKKTQTFKGNETVYSLFIFTSLAFNTNASLFHLECKQNNQKTVISYKDYHLLIQEVIKTNEIVLTLIQNYSAMENMSLYYSNADHLELHPSIDELIAKWGKVNQSEYFFKEHFFPQLHANELFSPILNTFFNPYTKISRSEFMEAAKATEKDFCIFHLIVGFDADRRPFLNNISFFEMPRTLLTDPKLSIFDKIFSVKRTFERKVDPERIEFLINEFCFFAHKTNLNSEQENLAKELYLLISQIDSEQEKESYKKLKNPNSCKWIDFKNYWVLCIFVEAISNKITAISRKEIISVIWDCFYKFDSNQKNRILDGLVTIFSQLPSNALKSEFLNCINSSILTDYYNFICRLLNTMLCTECKLEDSSQGKLIDLFEAFNRDIPILYSTVLFFYGYYCADKIKIKDKKEELLQSASQIYDKPYQLSVYYCLYKAKQLNEKDIRRNNGIITILSLNISEQDCRNILFERKLNVISNDLFEKILPLLDR